MFLSQPSGPRPFLPILQSPHRKEIDRRLFINKEAVLSVSNWLRDECNVKISYSMLNRYKHSVLFDKANDPDVRRKEMLSDLRYLARVIKAGKESLKASLAVRPNEAMRAVELRSQILQSFPDLSDERVRDMIDQQKVLTDAVLAVVSEDQRITILEILKEKFGESGQAA